MASLSKVAGLFRFSSSSSRFARPLQQAAVFVRCHQSTACEWPEIPAKTEISPPELFYTVTLSYHIKLCIRRHKTLKKIEREK